MAYISNHGARDRADAQNEANRQRAHEEKLARMNRPMPESGPTLNVYQSGPQGGGAPAPAAPEPQAAAMQGLEQAISAPPGPGWGSDPAMMATVGSLGERSMGTPMDALRQVFQKRGRVY